MKQRLKVFALALVLGVCAVMPFTIQSAQAANPLSLPTPKQTSLNGTNTSITGTISDLAIRVINITFLIAGILAVLYLLWSGVQYITAGGNADRVGNARKGIINAVIGIVVIMAAYFIIRLATSTRNEFDKDLKGTYAPMSVTRIV